MHGTTKIKNTTLFMLSFEMCKLHSPKKETTLSLSSPGVSGKAFVFISKLGKKGVETNLMTAKKLVFSSSIIFPQPAR
jgi:hypothetical protein